MFFQNCKSNVLESSPFQSYERSTTSLSLNMKESIHKQMVIIKNLLQQMNFLNTVIWRQNTCMPIVQILSFKNQTTDPSYPKTYVVEVESMEKQIKKLSNLELKDSLYLIQQCLLGIQAISYKYHNFDFHTIFYGLNQKGECKTWINQNFLAFEVNPIPLPKQDIIINHILRMVSEISNPTARSQLQTLLIQSAKHINIGYTQVHQKIKEFAYRKNIMIPNCVQFQKRESLLFKTRSDIILEPCTHQRKEPLKLKYNFQQSQRKSESSKQILNHQNNSKQNRLVCQSQFIQRSSPLLKMKKISLQQKSCQVKVRVLQKNKSVQNMLMKPYKLKNKLKESKDFFNISMKGSSKVLKYSFAPEDKSQQTCTSLTFPAQNIQLSPGQSHRNYKNRLVNQKTNTFSSIHLAQRNFFQEAAHKEHRSFIKESQTCFQVNIKESQQKTHLNIDRNYNFGGLIPLPQKSIKQSQQIQDHHYFQMPSEPKLLLNLKKGREKVLKSMVLSHHDFKDNYLNVGWDWQNKMSKLITQDSSNLKQSVYCGQEKKPQPLQIKLQKLGKLGRQITSTVMHQVYQH